MGEQGDLSAREQRNDITRPTSSMERVGSRLFRRCPTETRTGLLSRRWFLGTISIFVVVIMLLSSVPIDKLPTSNSHSKTLSGAATNETAPYLPYLVNASGFPQPDTLPNETGSLLLPQLATLIVGNIPEIVLTYVHIDSWGNHIVEFRTGTYNASMAQAIAIHGCTDACTQRVPIAWGAPVPVATYGQAPIQQLAIATGTALGNDVALAVASNNSTELYISAHEGAAGTWNSLTGATPVWGDEPQIYLEAGCSVYLTTLDPNGAVVTKFTIYGFCSGPSVPPSNQGPLVKGGGGGTGPLVQGSAPVVSEVVVQEAEAGTTVTINGTGFSTVQQVLFGGAAANFSISSSTSISAVVPAGEGITNVTAWNPYGWNSINCSDEFEYGPTLPAHSPQVEWVSPQSVGQGGRVYVGGVNLGSATSVTFGNSSATFTVISPTELSTTAPSGSGSTNITVTTSVGTSLDTCASRFQYSSPPEPVVTSLTPILGPSGTTVTISGTNFVSNATVAFGATPGTSVTYHSASQLTAKSPSSSGTVSVTVSQWGFQSQPTCKDLYTYAATTNALLTSLNESSGPGNSSLSISGSNLGGSTAYIGGIAVGTLGSTGGSVQVPQGVGSVQVRASGTKGVSPPTCADDFTITGPSLPRLPKGDTVIRTAVSLPVLASTALVPLNGAVGGFAIVATNVSATPGLAIYYANSSAKAVPMVPVNDSAGSQIFDSIGDTSTSTTALSPGIVAAGSNGSELFIAMTTDEGGRTALATLASTSAGANWTGPYLSAATEGSILDPSVVVSPVGYAFVSWLEGSAGNWQLELAVYSSSGSLLRAAQPIQGAGGNQGISASTPTLIVDPDVRPILAWSVPTSGNSSEIQYTGAFLNPREETSALWAGFNSTVPADFENFGQQGLSEFEQRVHGLFSDLETNISSGSLCGELHDSLWLYTNLTWIDWSAITPGPVPTGCQVNQGLNNSILADTWGVMDANVYLGVESMTLLESLGIGTMPTLPWGMIGWQGASTPPGAFTPGTEGSAHDSRGDVVSTVPWTVTPDAVWLYTRSNFPPESGTFNNTYRGINCGSRTLTDEPTTYQVQVQVDGGALSQPFTSSSTVPSVYVSNLTSMQTGTWKEDVSVDFETTNESRNTCPASDGYQNGTFTASTPTGWPSEVSLTIAGGFTTGLDPYPATIILNSTKNGTTGNMTDTLNWTNTIDADANIWLNASCGRSCDVHWSNSSFQLPDNAAGQGLQSVQPKNYTLTLQTQSSSGLGNWSWSPLFNANQVSVAAPPETVQISCSFDQLQNPAQSWISQANVVTNITGSSALVTWYSKGQGLGWVTYNTTDGGTTRETAQSTLLANGSSEYYAQLHGLEPWAIYQAVGHVEVQSGCSTQGQPVGIAVNYPSQTSGFSFQTLAQVPLQEQDYPYDSVTQQGGGAIVFWRVPEPFQNISSFDNGSLSYHPKGNTSATLVVTLQPPLPAIYSIPGTGKSAKLVNSTFGLNLTGLTGNTNYIVNLTMNYTLRSGGQHIVVTGEPFNFTYEQSSTGDGLTDWEKEYGWTVTYDPLFGWLYGWESEHVSPITSLYATNGLVGDFVEKEYDLNPNTVDTAGSHMLDTWNLTFNLKPGGGHLPAGLNVQAWSEGTLYNPFNTSVQFTPGHHETGGPIAQNISNISANAAGGKTSGDGAPWAAEALWSYSALEKFVNLSGVKAASWLRAMEGSWDGLPTLTIEGKLSWGANPLAASTPNDAFPDGERINPLTEVGLEFSPVYANASALTTGTGFAVKMSYDLCNAGEGCSPVSNYSLPAIFHETPGSISNYSVELPVSQTYSDTIELQVVANESGNMVPLVVNNGNTAVNETCNMVLGTCPSIGVSGSAANLHGTMKVVPIGVKAPTWLWVPTDNSTVNGLPVGLERYTGEQAFDLVAVNVSSPVSSDPVPLPWGGTAAAVQLSKGLNNILIPREQFMDSPLGQAILLGQNTSYNTSMGAPPLVGSAEQNLISRFSGSNWMVDLGAYWQNRAISSGPGNITGSSEGGTPVGNKSELQVMAATSASRNNSGGIPSAPSLYNTSDAPAAVQAIVTLNITSNATLDLLLAGLFDNVSGGVNGSFQSITYQVPFLGLDRVVGNALANATWASDGLYGAPTSRILKQTPTSAWGIFWNAVSSAVKTVAKGILSLEMIVWNATTAAFTFLNQLGHEAAVVDGKIWAREASTLVSVGKTISRGLQWVLASVASGATHLLSIAFSPLIEGMKAYSLQLAYDLMATYNDSEAHKPITGDVAKFWNDAGGNLFLAAIGLGVAVFCIFEVLQGLTLGVAFIIPIIVGLLLTGFLAAEGSEGGPTYFNDFTNINPISSGAAAVWEDIWNSNPPPYLTTLADLMSAGSTALAADLIESDVATGSSPTLDMLAFGLGLVGIIESGIASLYSSVAGTVVSFLFDGASIIVDILGARELPLLVNTVIFGVDGGTAAIDIYTLHNDGYF
jgi:hypothetical protein